MRRILLIDNHDVVREGVKRILGEQTLETEFGEARDLASGLALIAEREWDLVILDLSLGGRSGLELLKEARQVRPRLPILVLTMHSEEQYARRAFRAGAAGYITKDSSRSELTRAISKVLQGGKYVSQELAEKMVAFLGERSDQPLHQALSDREFEVMRLIASGKTVTEIASLLYLSDKTISTYRARVLEKMGMRTSAELTHYTIANNLIE